jgi:group I intron endonuclease
LAGVYKRINKINNNIYVGSSIELSNRFTRYFNRSYLKSNNYIISKALLKYGYEKFSLEIIEYCDASIVLIREQYYLDLFNPIYNIAKTADHHLELNVLLKLNLN